MAGLDQLGGHLARALGLEAHPLRPVAMHAKGQLLDVEDDIGHILQHAGDRRELMQHALDLHRGHRRTLQRRQQHAAQRIAQGQSETALQRLGDDVRLPLGIAGRIDGKLVRLNQLSPIFLNHGFDL